MTKTTKITTHNELSALVAQKVMGWKWAKLGDERVMRNGKGDRIFVKEPNGEICTTENFGYDYSTDIAAAIAIAQGREYSMFCGKEFSEVWVGSNDPENPYLVNQKAPTLPLAICLAALQQEGVEVELDLGE